MANIKILSKEKGKLTWGQISYFINGSTWTFLDKAFPFSSENERGTLWKSHKKEVIDFIYCEKKEFPNEWRCPDDSQLRPHEWWLRDAPEPRLFLNEAHTLRETDAECLQRNDLLTDRDREKMATEAFQKAEAERIAYRSYVMESAVRVVQPFPSPSTPTERGEIPDMVIPLEAPPEEGLPEKPPPPESAGQCPKCSGKLKNHSSSESICDRCGIIFSKESLGSLWKSVDTYARERRAGHRIAGDE